MVGGGGQLRVVCRMRLDASNNPHSTTPYNPLYCPPLRSLDYSTYHAGFLVSSASTASPCGILACIVAHKVFSPQKITGISIPSFYNFGFRVYDLGFMVWGSG